MHRARRARAGSAIDVPTLITVGDRDLLTPPPHAYEMHERMPGSVLHVWPAMGHAPFWEIPGPVQPP